MHCSLLHFDARTLPCFMTVRAYFFARELRCLKPLAFIRNMISTALRNYSSLSLSVAQNACKVKGKSRPMYEVVDGGDPGLALSY